MKAVAKLRAADGAMELIDAPTPEPGPGEVLVRIEAAGICGTDVAIRHWFENVVGQYAPNFPLIVGHEFGGRVVGGSRDARFSEGTLVAINPQIACGRCEYCNLGRPTLCVNRRLMGGKVDGGWAEYVSVPERNLYALPVGTHPAISALAEPLSVATHAVCERVTPQPGDVVVVIGAGPIGLLCVVLALAAGASKVFVTGIGADRARLELARKLGGIPIDVEASDPLAIVREAQEDGADIVYETSGSHAVMTQAISLARRTGRIGLIGLCHCESHVLTTPLVLRELTMIGSRGYNDTTWSVMMRVLPKIEPQVLALVSHTLPLERYDEALDLVERKEANKIILLPQTA